jgi:hypothetical protein
MTGFVTVVMPIHPLVGARLRVVRRSRLAWGQEVVEVETAGGWLIQLPVVWTDLRGPWMVLRLGKRPLWVSVDRLLMLVRALEAVRAMSSSRPGCGFEGAG